MNFNFKLHVQHTFVNRFFSGSIRKTSRSEYKIPHQREQNSPNQVSQRSKMMCNLHFHRALYFPKNMFQIQKMLSHKKRVVCPVSCFQRSFWGRVAKEKNPLGQWDLFPRILFFREITFPFTLQNYSSEYILDVLSKKVEHFTGR